MCPFRLWRERMCRQKMHRSCGKSIIQILIACIAWLLLQYHRINYCLTHSLCHFLSLQQRQEKKFQAVRCKRTNPEAGETGDKRSSSSFFCVILYCLPPPLYLSYSTVILTLAFFSLTNICDQIRSPWVLKPTCCSSGVAARHTNSNLTCLNPDVPLMLYDMAVRQK